MLIEQRLDFSRWVENGFGTGDCVIVADEALQIIDYKQGVGVLVSAEKNPQMMCYALGALELFDGLYDIQEVRMPFSSLGVRMSVPAPWQKKNCSPGRRRS